MSQHRLWLRNWSGWAAGLPKRDDWQKWLPNGGPLEEIEAKPPCKAAKPMMRRRYSLATRMAIEAAGTLSEAADVPLDQVHRQSLLGDANNLGCDK